MKNAHRDGLNRVRKGNETMRFNMLHDAKNAGNNKKFWSIWNENNVNKVSNHVHSSNNFAKQFCLNFDEKNNDEKVNIDKFLEKLTGENDCNMLNMLKILGKR